MNIKILLSVFLLFICSTSNAQEVNKTPKYWEDVQTIKKYDKIYKPLPNPIVFVGSSSIRLWNRLDIAFGEYNVLNRGIGGAVVNDILFYLDDLVLDYSPRQIVIYVGGNDFVDKNVTPDTVFRRTVNLYQAIRTKLPAVPVVYISIQSAPSREAHTERVIEFNKKIKGFLAKQENTSFVDVFNALRKDGKNRPELFVKDMLHLNKDGYAIWEKEIKSHLKP